MADKVQDMEFRLREYLARHGYSASWRQLGAGADGTVITTMRNPEVNSAVKVFGYSEQFLRELAVYERLAEHNLHSIDGIEGLTAWGFDKFAIPELFDADRDLLVVEISIVTPPYILDFASAYLDSPPARYSDKEFVAVWHEEAKEKFGTAKWKIVRRIMARLRRYGIFLTDVKPGNIMFGDEDTDLL